MIERLAAVSGRHVSRETFERVQQFADLLIAENAKQNLISGASAKELWERHILDGAQLLALAGGRGRWCDIGSGAGLPGMIIAILSNDPVVLIEPRRLRVDFLRATAARLGLEQVTVEAGKAEHARGQFDFITARAVAKLSTLFSLSTHLSHGGTRWILPKGQKAKTELDEARRTWQGSFRLVPSQTDPDAAIVVAEGVEPRGKP